MQTTIVANDIGSKDNASGVCSLLSSEGQKYIAGLQEQLVHELGDSMWCMPGYALHITLCEILQPKLYSEDKEMIFQRNQAQYRQALEEILATIPPIKIVFNQVEVSQQAIIVRGSDDHALDAIRKQLIKRLPLPAQTKQPPAIVHSSIARFTKEIDLDIVKSAISKMDILFTETISEFQLMHNVSPHNLDYQVAARFPLNLDPDAKI